MDLSIGELRDWIVIVLAVGQVGIVLLGLYFSRIFVRRGEFERLADRLAGRLEAQDERLGSGARRFDVLQERLERLPSSNEIRTLSEGLARVETSISGLQDRFSTIDGILRSHENRLAQLLDHELRAIRRGAEET